MGSWHSFAGYRRQKATLEIIRTYAEKGEPPPEALLAALADSEHAEGRGAHRSPAHYWSLAGLFGVMAAGFGVAGFAHGFEGVGWPFGIVALVMGAVAVWSIINAFMFARQPRP